jgi:molybdate/tungstate transport system permease protein
VSPARPLSLGPAARLPAALLGLGPLALALLVAPFLTLAVVTDWAGFGLARGDLGAVATSLGYTSLAMLVVAGLGTPLAWWLARHDFPGKLAAEALVLAALLTPPLALGILLASLYGPYSAVGGALQRAGLTLTNTPAAFVLAQVYGATPYYVLTARAAFEGVPRELERIGLTLGKEPWQVFLTVTLPLARTGLAAALALAWVRALGEFGTALIIAYYPQGIPVKLWVNLQDAGLSAVYPLLWLFFLAALPLPVWLGLAARRSNGWRA